MSARGLEANHRERLRDDRRSQHDGRDIRRGYRGVPVNGRSRMPAMIFSVGAARMRRTATRHLRETQSAADTADQKDQRQRDGQEMTHLLS